MTIQTLERKLRPFEEPIQNTLLKWLYLHLPPQPIKNRAMYHAYIKAVEVLMKEQEIGSLAHSSRVAISQYLDSVIPFIERYEKKEFITGSVTPEAMLRFLMEQNNLSQYDLAEELGGQSVVSAILNGKRQLTREHIEKLSRRFHMTPASFYPASKVEE